MNFLDKFDHFYTFITRHNAYWGGGIGFLAFFILCIMGVRYLRIHYVWLSGYLAAFALVIVLSLFVYGAASSALVVTFAVLLAYTNWPIDKKIPLLPKKK